MPVRLKLAAGLALVLIAAPLLFVIQQAVVTLQTLTRVERERDTWQHPEQILTALNLRPGVVVVDLGSGAGYFALKMAPRVAPQGRVLAVDLRTQSLAFLWIRALRDGHNNLDVIRGDVDNPRLPAGPVDAALIANTFHELTRPEPVMRALLARMRAGARLVVVDRAPRDGTEPDHDETAHHDIGGVDVERVMTGLGLETVSRDDRFIERDPGGAQWWLVVFRKP